MRSEYSWRDGWALVFPHPIPPKEPKLNPIPEKVYRCPCVGILVYEGNECPVCDRKAGNDNT